MEANDGTQVNYSYVPKQFKRRQGTGCYSALFSLIATGLVIHCVVLVRATKIYYLIPALAVLVLIMIALSLTVAWCEIEDLGTSLSVKFGPWAVHKTIIAYDDILLYRDTIGCFETCAGYHVGEVNSWTKTRYHSKFECENSINC